VRKEILGEKKIAKEIGRAKCTANESVAEILNTDKMKGKQLQLNFCI
jgi:hypothetical protein